MKATASTGLNWRGMTDAYIQVLTRPSEASFQAAKASSNSSSTLIALLIVGAIVGLFSRLTSGDLGAVVTGIVLGAILGVIGYYIVQVILLIFAKLFGGRGSLGVQANTLVTFYAPLTLLNAIFGLVPVIGMFVSLVIAIDELVLLTFGLKAVHEYSTGKAILTWLTPALVVIVILAILLIVFGALILRSLSSL
ncbi:MAG: YIP1 family protein [Chloroflexi bacterium]|nr:YIP1 family protein [Chloroflexota bacterium]